MVDMAFCVVEGYARTDSGQSRLADAQHRAADA
jgi:hypothetical protein